LQRDTINTGFLYVRGIYETVEAPDALRKACRKEAKQLRETLDYSTESIQASLDNPVSGRIELHILGGKDISGKSSETLTCHVWLSSDIENRAQVESTQVTSEGNVNWDKKATFFTNNAKSDFLRIEIVCGYA